MATFTETSFRIVSSNMEKESGRSVGKASMKATGRSTLIPSISIVMSGT